MQIETEKQCELRSFCSELSGLTRPDGSATFNQGDTTVLAAVYGPGDVKQSKEIIDKATVEVVFKPKVGLPGVYEKSQEQLIQNSCASAILATLHPRTSILIIVQVVQDSGSLLSCSINASCLALMDAGIPMKYLVCSITSALDKEGKIILDPTDKQCKDALSVITCAFDSHKQNIVTVSLSGSCSIEQIVSGKEVIKILRWNG
ncbi:exosome complex component RRP46-like [Anneissia japonica]|uniref:exosome complex component RRP46-like n=1 Tax=Anneissia japonica TaxID=1529436 RepID=UPI0014255A15|nr:exosome complex component RRP46-like [Anneissia japonica]